MGRFGGKAEQAVEVGVRRVTAYFFYFGLYWNFFSHNTDQFFSIAQKPAERTDRQVTDKKKGVVFIRQVILQVMNNPSAVAHSRSGDNYFRRSDFVYFFGLFRFHSENKSGRLKKVVPFQKRIF